MFFYGLVLNLFSSYDGARSVLSSTSVVMECLLAAQDLNPSACRRVFTSFTSLNVFLFSVFCVADWNKNWKCKWSERTCVGEASDKDGCVTEVRTVVPGSGLQDQCQWGDTGCWWTNAAFRVFMNQSVEGERRDTSLSQSGGVLVMNESGVLWRKWACLSQSVQPVRTKIQIRFRFFNRFLLQDETCCGFPSLTNIIVYIWRSFLRICLESSSSMCLTCSLHESDQE